MITVRDLRYTYLGRTEAAVQGISFEIAEGEIFGFLGPSGAGKSTTQKIIIGLLKGYAGQVQVLGRDVAAWDQSFYEHIGVGFELPNHYLKLTGLENLNHFRGLYSGPTADPQTLLEMVGLGDAANLRVNEYSKGMQMRLNFIRALVHDPQILFFDEPTSGLDPNNARVIKDIILEQKRRGKTIFLTTHNMNVADELCDRVGFITNGRIQALNSPSALKLAHGQRRVAVAYGHNGQAAVRQFPLDNLGHNAEFSTLLQTEYIQTIHTQEATLEDIFIHVTGQQLAE